MLAKRLIQSFPLPYHVDFTSQQIFRFFIELYFEEAIRLYLHNNINIAADQKSMLNCEIKPQGVRETVRYEYRLLVLFYNLQAKSSGEIT